MWLDGLYKGEPFYAEYSMAFGETTGMTLRTGSSDGKMPTKKTGLYHGWDESKWPTTGRSPNFWGRARRYAMVIDTLSIFQR
jgi:unsaturated rhamnogalacturonyl hydrolase